MGKFYFNAKSYSLLAEMTSVRMSYYTVDLKFPSRAIATALFEELNRLRGKEGINCYDDTILFSHSHIEDIFGKGTLANDTKIALARKTLDDYFNGNKYVSLESLWNLTSFDKMRILLTGSHYLAKAIQNPDRNYLDNLLKYFPNALALQCAMLKPYYGESPWKLAATHLAPDLFLNLFNHFIPVKIHVDEDKPEMNLLHYAAQYQPLKVFQSVFNRTDWIDFRKCALVKDENGAYLFETILLKQSPDLAREYLLSIRPNQMTEIYQASLDLCAHMIVTNSTWFSTFNILVQQYAELPEMIFDKIKERNKIYPALSQGLLELNFWEPNRIAAQSWLRDNQANLVKPDNEFIPLPEKNEINIIQDEKTESLVRTRKQQVSYLHPNFTAIAWNEGFDSPADFNKAYRYFQKTKNMPALKCLDTLISKRKVFAGIALSQEKYQAFVDDKRQHRFHIAMTKYTAQEIESLIDLMPSHLLEIEIAKLDPNKSTALKIAAKRLEKKNFAKLCEKVSTDVLRNASIMTNYQEENTFHDAAVHQSIDNIRLLTNSFSWHSNDLRDTLQKKNAGQTAPIHLLVYFQTDPQLAELLGTFSTEEQRTLLSTVDANNNTTLSIAISRQPEATALSFLNRINDTTIVALQNNDGRCLLEQAFAHQTPEIVLYIMSFLLTKHNYDSMQQRYDYPEVTKVFNQVLKKEPIKMYFAYSLLTQKKWYSNDRLVTELFRHSGAYFLSFFSAVNYYGISLPNPIKNILQENIEQEYTARYNGLDATIAAWKERLQSFSSSQQALMLNSEIHSPFPERIQNEFTSVRTSKKTLLHINDPQFLITLYREGVLNHSEYYKLRKMSSSVPGLCSALDRLVQSNRLLTGSFHTWEPETTSNIPYTTVRQLLDQGQLLFQLFPQGTWPDMLKRLNHEEEQKIIPEAKGITHQYIHLDDTIIPYQPVNKNEEKQYPMRNAPVISLANGLNTNVTTQDEKISSHVGLLYNRAQCVVTAMFNTEIDTSKQEWLGTQEQVEAYAKRIKPLHHATIASLQAALTSYPYKVNLTLANLAPEAAVAICIASEDTLENRLYARAIATEFSATFHRELPIVILYPYYGLSMYLPEKQAADVIEKANGMQINPYAANEAKARLLALRHDIHQHKQWGNKGVLLFKKAVETAPDAAKNIVTLIDQTEKSAHPFWEKTAKAVNQQLKENSGNKNEVEQFFEIERKKYFK